MQLCAELQQQRDVYYRSDLLYMGQAPLQYGHGLIDFEVTTEEGDFSNEACTTGTN